MKIISVFNNKGGVGKTTLTYHLAHILAEMGKKVLILDLDSQCNISLYGMKEEELEKIWREEDDIIDNGFNAYNPYNDDVKKLFTSTRTTHFLLKSVEDGISDYEELPPPFKVTENLDLIPSRLTLFMYENRISERWNGMFLGESLSIKTLTKIRKLAESYSNKNHYDFVIIDTSSNLGALNKIMYFTADGFIIPCTLDGMSLFAIKSLGKILNDWDRQFNTCFKLILESKRKEFPEKSVRFLGYTLYNAKRKIDDKEQLCLTHPDFNYAKKIPNAIKEYISETVRKNLTEDMVQNSIGNNSISYTHNTLPNMAQKYKQPMWKIPNYCDLNDKGIIIANRKMYEDTRAMYEAFAKDLLIRIATLDEQ
ncbi:MAG: ParA family protein [Methylococcaceae bacterium]